MMFESTKKKQLQEVKQRVSMLKQISEVRKEHTMLLVEREIYTPEQMAKHIDSLYTFYIRQLEQIEDDIYI